MPGRAGAAAAGAAGTATGAAAAAGAAGAFATGAAGLAGALLKLEGAEREPPIRFACAIEGATRETTVRAITAAAEVERKPEKVRMEMDVLKWFGSDGRRGRMRNLSIVGHRKKQRIRDIDSRII